MGFTASAAVCEVCGSLDELNWRRVRRYADQKAAARLLRRIDGPENVRSDLVERLRAQISAGTYESDEKLDIAVERLIADL